MNTGNITTHGPRVARWTLVAALGLLAGCARTMVETPNLYTNTDTPLFGPMSASTEGNVVEVLYATKAEIGGCVAPSSASALSHAPGNKPLIASTRYVTNCRRSASPASRETQANGQSWLSSQLLAMTLLP